jgi:hypothetical protein
MRIKELTKLVKCPNCAVPFEAWDGISRTGGRLYCSGKCFAACNPGWDICAGCLEPVKLRGAIMDDNDQILHGTDCLAALDDRLFVGSVLDD